MRSPPSDRPHELLVGDRVARGAASQDAHRRTGGETFGESVAFGGDLPELFGEFFEAWRRSVIGLGGRCLWVRKERRRLQHVPPGRLFGQFVDGSQLVSENDAVAVEMPGQREMLRQSADGAPFDEDVRRKHADPRAASPAGSEPAEMAR